MRTLFTCFALLWAGAVLAEYRGDIQYAVAHTEPVCFYDYSTGIAIEPTITLEDGDLQLSIDGTEDSAAGSDFTLNDNGNCFDLVMSATQTTGAYISVIFNDDDNVWMPFSLDFHTFGDLSAADKTRGIASGTAQGGSTTTVQLASATSFADNYLDGAVIFLNGGTGAGERCHISTWTSSTDTAACSNTLQTAPSTDTTYIVLTGYQGYLAADSNGVVQSNVKQVSDDASAANNLESDYDGTGYNKSASTLGTVTDLLGISGDTDALDQLEASIDQELNCEVNTANFAGSTTTLACILTDTAGSSVTQATSDLLGKAITITSGADIRETRYINSTTWDGTNSELQITLDSALPSTQADAVTAIIQ